MMLYSYRNISRGAAVFGAITIAICGFAVNVLGASARSHPSLSLDFDGDGRDDISVFRPSDGYWYVAKSSGGNLSVQWGLGTDTVVPGDYNDDGRCDFAVYRQGRFPNQSGGPGLSTWYVLTSSDYEFSATQWGESSLFGIDVPSPADYDGDGKLDITVYKLEDTVPGRNVFRVLKSSSDTMSTEQWGFNSDKVAPADYDGDGKADHAVYRNGTWFILQSWNGTMRVEHFGLGTDKVVPGDFDGDGRADLAVWRQSNGFWYVLQSSNGLTRSVQFGLSDDKPTSADFDGDGKTDLAVFRPATGTWYLLQSTEGFRAEQFGLANDIPLANIFVR